MAKSKKSEEMAQDAQNVRVEVTGKYEGMTAEEIQRMEEESMAKDVAQGAGPNPDPNPTPNPVQGNTPTPAPRVLAELFSPNGTFRVELLGNQSQGGKVSKEWMDAFQDKLSRFEEKMTGFEGSAYRAEYVYEEIFGSSKRYLEDGALIDRTTRLERQVGATGMDAPTLVGRVEKLESEAKQKDSEDGQRFMAIEDRIQSYYAQHDAEISHISNLAATANGNALSLGGDVESLRSSYASLRSEIEPRMQANAKSVYDLKRFIGQEDNADIQVREDVKQLLQNPQDYILGVVPSQGDLTPLTESLNSLKSRMDYLGQIRAEMDQLHNWLGKVFFDKNKINWAANKGFEMPRADAMGLLQDGINATLEAWFTSKGLSVSGLEKLKSDVESLERSISNLWSKVTLLEERMGG